MLKKVSLQKFVDLDQSAQADLDRTVLLLICQYPESQRTIQLQDLIRCLH